MTIKKGTSIIATGSSTEWGSIEGTLSDQTDLQNALNEKVGSISPSFSGIPTAPTAAEGTNTTQIATTAFVKNAVDNIDALPDQTDMEGKYLATDGLNAFWKSPAGLPLLSHIWADHLLNDASFLRSDTFSWQSGNIYKSAYDHLETDFLNGEIGHSDTDGGVTVFYRLCADGHKICSSDQEQNVMDYYTANGVAWYYILDTQNKRFKLPRTKYGFTGLRDAVGKYVPETLPNITGNLEGIPAQTTSTSISYGDGVFGSTNSDSTKSCNSGGSNQPQVHITFDAADSSSVYQNNAPVQQRATQMYLYFYVGNTIRNETEVDVGEITEALDGKLDQDLGNASSSFKSIIDGYSMPDYSAAITVSNTGSFQSPNNGYFFVTITGGASSSDIEINGVVVAHGWWTNTGVGARVCIPMKKNDTIIWDTQRIDGTINFVKCAGD